MLEVLPAIALKGSQHIGIRWRIDLKLDITWADPGVCVWGGGLDPPLENHKNIVFFSQYPLWQNFLDPHMYQYQY